MKCDRCGKDFATLTFTSTFKRGNIFAKDYSDSISYAYVCGRCRRLSTVVKVLFFCLFVCMCSIPFILPDISKELSPSDAIPLGVGGFLLVMDRIGAWFHGKPYVVGDSTSEEP